MAAGGGKAGRAGSGGREHAGEDAARSRARPVLVRVKKPGRLHLPSWMGMLRGLAFSGRARS
jgi:hypothetical protein